MTPAEQLAHEELVDREERAAVFEYEAGFSREVAEMLAGLRPNPSRITPELADRAKNARGSRPRRTDFRKGRRWAR